MRRRFPTSSDRRQPKYAFRETHRFERSQPAEVCRSRPSRLRRRRHRASSTAGRVERVELGNGFDPTQRIVLGVAARPATSAAMRRRTDCRREIGNDETQFAQAPPAPSFAHHLHSFGRPGHLDRLSNESASVTRYKSRGQQGQTWRGAGWSKPRSCRSVAFGGDEAGPGTDGHDGRRDLSARHDRLRPHAAVRRLAEQGARRRCSSSSTTRRGARTTSCTATPRPKRSCRKSSAPRPGRACAT